MKPLAPVMATIIGRIYQHSARRGLVRRVHIGRRMTDNTAHPGGATASIWMGTFEMPSYPPHTSDASADVCIVGAGIAGLSTAYMLTKAGKKVIVVDDGPVGGGETARTTAHLSNAMDDRIYVLEHVHGEDGARKIVQSHGAAIDMIEQIVRNESIDCDFRRLDGFLFLGGGDSERVLDEELAAAERAGIAGMEKLPRIPEAGFDSGPCLRFPNQAQFHVLKYLAGVAAAVTRDGGRIYSGTHVTAINGGAPCTVDTDAKRTITADAVCVCTNASIADMFHTHMKQAPYRSMVIAALVPRSSVHAALYWDTGDQYHYVRLQPLADDHAHDALIVGGEDYKTGHADDEPARWRRLEEWMRERWPQAGEVVYRWSGQVLEPNDFIAFIGRSPTGAENVYMCSGDSGQGMTHGTIAGMLLTDLITGQPNDWESLYDPKRVSLRARPIEQFVKENADVALQFVKDYLLTGDLASADAIPAGEGRIIRRGAHKIAAYRDADGTLHECSAVCTHLRCIVGWNSSEQVWDCPCHGSRFDPYGKVITGPAVTDLERLSS
jgi:glycine/D-amino acid oxidase-like deaminating enzyme/nitrite reductase/ring-hydroxylating ferredoxin subunit